eukprot:274158-Hanusia_phi.AAC.1
MKRKTLAHKKPAISHAHTHTQSKKKPGKPRAQSTGPHTEQPAAQSALVAPSPVTRARKSDQGAQKCRQTPYVGPSG